MKENGVDIFIAYIAENNTFILIFF